MSIYYNKLLAISGIKNAGKTTLLERLLPLLQAKGLKIAVIKHDGHDFIPDVPGTDSDRFRRAGAYGVGVFSGNRFMVYKEEPIDEKKLMAYFPEADLILCEGLKFSPYPKIEIVRSAVSTEPVCEKETLIGVISDLPLTDLSVPIFPLDARQELADFIVEWMRTA